MNERITSAMMKHCAWGVEGLRLEPPENDGKFAEEMIELVAASLALDNGAFTDFIVMVLETRKSMNEIMADAKRCNWPEPLA